MPKFFMHANGQQEGIAANLKNSHNFLARSFGHPLGVYLLSKSIQTDSFFRNVFLDQK